MLDAHNITKLKDRMETYAVYILNPNAVRYLGLKVTWSLVTLYAQWQSTLSHTNYIALNMCKSMNPLVTTLDTSFRLKWTLKPAGQMNEKKFTRVK